MTANFLSTSLAFGIALLFSVPLEAQNAQMTPAPHMASSSSDDRWVSIASTNEADIYVDKKTITHAGDLIDVWVDTRFEKSNELKQ